MLIDGGSPPPAACPGLRCVGFFPGLGSRAAYRSADRALLDSDLPAVREIYKIAAGAIGRDAADLFTVPERVSPLDRMSLTGVSVLAHSLALHARFDASSDAECKHEFVAYTGESFGIITAAVAAGAATCSDGVEIARVFMPLMMVAADGLGVDDPFVTDNLQHVADLLRGVKLVTESHHVIALNAPPPDLGNALDRISRTFPTFDVEVHKFYSACQTNLYVRVGARQAFDKLARDLPGVTVRDLKPPTTFLAHSSRMSIVRCALKEHILQSGIDLKEPIVPLISNHGASMIHTAAGVMEAMLAITDKVMASIDTVRTITQLHPDVVIELGYGGHAVGLMNDNRISIPSRAYTGGRLNLTDLRRRCRHNADEVRGRRASREPASGDGGAEYRLSRSSGLG